MARSDFRLLKRTAVHWPAKDISRVPNGTRGVYFLHLEDKPHMNVVYVGKAEKQGIKARLHDHLKDPTKKWTHFSAYEFNDNIFDEEIGEIEALFLTAYAKDGHANTHNRQRGSKKLRNLRKETELKWPVVKGRAVQRV